MFVFSLPLFGGGVYVAPSCCGSVLHILFVNIVFYSLIKSQELKDSVPSDLRHQVFLLVRPMHQVSACLPYSI